ncbi:MAG: acetyl-CoA carboxylase biotin carboxylase subunit [Chlorobi bacterium]|nr:acetyl-CoA carboxylase biotin carboxylase subunit [Chlorobiota bacterium]
MFTKVLIANRGEIAIRIARTCKRLGIRTVAVYSNADAYSPHVRACDEAYPIGGTTPRESYLVIEKVLDAAHHSGAEAIHPGYGFLSENATFAEAVERSGKVFIGPSPEAIRLLGDKTAARRLAIDLGVPVAPGSDGAVRSLEEARGIATRIGYPLLIKAAAGGGGKGMRLVEDAHQLDEFFASAQREALSAFGDDRVFIERYIVHPRHIEIQVLADKHGTVLYFPERECSIQRRHQKVIEESPSPAVSTELRQRMGQAAARLIHAAGYTNAGTVEFLLDADGSFYFMEVNTRLQVEHPVTEMIAGVDFVEQQLRIAASEPLQLRQDEVVQPRGHAIECRICAEDVFNDFLPDTGTIRQLILSEGEGIRNDCGIEEGSVVSVYYDPMVAKLIVWAPTRDECIERTLNALDQYVIAGVRTTIPFCHYVLCSEPFRSGMYSTRYVNQHWQFDQPTFDNPPMLAAIAARVYDDYMQRRMPPVLTQH